MQGVKTCSGSSRTLAESLVSSQETSNMTSLQLKKILKACAAVLLIAALFRLAAVHIPDHERASFRFPRHLNPGVHRAADSAEVLKVCPFTRKLILPMHLFILQFLMMMFVN